MSEEDKKTEEIRELLRKKLEGLPPPDDDWNVPSTGVWTGLSEELRAAAKPKPTRNWVARLGSIIAALLVILFWRECSNQRQLTSLHSEVEKVSTAYDKLQEACNERQSAALPATGSQADETKPTSPKTSVSVASPPTTNRSAGTRSAVPSQFLSPITRTGFTNKSINSIQMETGALTTASAILFSEQNSTELEAPAVLSKKQTLPGLLPLLAISSFENKPDKPQLDLHLPNPKNTVPLFQLIASLHGGLALTGNRLSGQEPAIIKDQKALLTWRTGLGLEAVLNRHWSLISGVDYTHSRVETDYNLAVPYTHNGEFQHDDGNFDNQYNHSLPSSLGNYPLQLVLTRESTANVEEGEVMNLDLAIKQQTRFVSLPLQLRYGLGKHRWQFGVKAGVFANHVLGISSETPKLVSHHGAIHERNTSIGTPPLSDLKNWTLDYTFGLDMRYQLTPRFGLSLSSAYQRGITPVYEDALVKNYLQAWSLGAGVQYYLR